MDNPPSQDPSNDPANDPSRGKPPTFWQMLNSVLAAAFGVQSNKNRERDFTHGKPGYFLVLGLLFTVLLVAILFGIVQLVLYLALE